MDDGSSNTRYSSIGTVSQDDDVIMGEAHELPHRFQDCDKYNENNLRDLHIKDDLDGDAWAELGLDKPDLTMDGKPKSRLLPIQVILTLPRNPTEYERIEKSQTVERVLDEMRVGRDVFFDVEFEDGHIEQASRDDLLSLRNGEDAVQQFQQQNLSDSQIDRTRYHNHRLPEDEYYDSDSSSRHERKRSKASQPGTRRSTRQPSGQTRADDDHQVNDIEDEDDFANQLIGPVAPTTGRTTRSKTKKSALHGQDSQEDSEDELAQDPNSDRDSEWVNDFPEPIRSDIRGAAGASSRKRKKAKRQSTSSRDVGRNSDIEFEPTRKSKRAKKASKSMRDPDIDDEYEAFEDNDPVAPRYVAIKEVFQEHPQESEFRACHSNVCDSCRSKTDKNKGVLIFCQGCSYSYHKQCIGVRSQREHRVTKVSPDEFVLQCKYCIGSHKKKDIRTPDYQMCQGCNRRGSSCAEFSQKRTPKQEEQSRIDNGGEDPVTRVNARLLNNPGKVLFRCSACRRAHHFRCLPSTTTKSDPADDNWEERLEECYLSGWKCRDCQQSMHKIDGLVAWRPANRDKYKKGSTDLEWGPDEIEYLVKWDGRSHLHDTWMPGAWVYGIAAAPTRTSFHKREDNQFPKMDTKSAIQEEWLLADVFLQVRYRRGSSASSRAEDLARISDITSVYVKFQGLGYEDSVWDEPPPRDSKTLWKAFRAAYDEYINGKYFSSARDQRMRERISHYQSLDFQKECELQSQPASLKAGHELMPYQMEGVNWLLYNFHQQQNVILADEMGLGKTIQIVSFITSLALDQPQCWPFLIVVPNATCPNWRRELKDWAPALRVVTYHGGKVSQDLSFKFELFPNGVKDGIKAHVVIMSYEAATTVKSTFNTVRWAGLIVDEGQRLKNEETQLYRTLVDMRIPCRILLTGTPLQNNKRELFNLLQFVDPKNDAASLDAQYEKLTKENVPELHNLIRPYFLRRTKAQVLRFLPTMAQVIVPVTMTLLQEKLSKSILSRNPELIRAIISKAKMKAGDRKNLSNIISDLRLCLCHPFCFSENVEDKTVGEEQMQRNLIEASPKLMLLEIMLPKLSEGGHRVLIFSQFLHSLDILEDFLHSLGLQYGRIDGKLSALEKQREIDAFNAPDSPLFAMLLSTRAGGVGINLATADTVIIYDPDWNPHQDLQAISRAHRIGQKEKVLCFQLMTKDSIEENILQAGKKKMALDHALIESLDADNDMDNDLETILKQGAESLFSDKKKVRITYDSMSVDKLLDRSQLASTNGDTPASDTQFSTARVWDNDSGALADNTDEAGDNNAQTTDESVWKNILKAREEEHKRQLAEQQKEYGRGARRRGTKGVDYSGTATRDPDSGGSEIDTDDELYEDNGFEEDDDDNGDTDEENGQATQPTDTKGPKEKPQAPDTGRDLAAETVKPRRQPRTQATDAAPVSHQPQPINPTRQAVERHHIDHNSTQNHVVNPNNGPISLAVPQSHLYYDHRIKSIAAVPPPHRQNPPTANPLQRSNLQHPTPPAKILPSTPVAAPTTHGKFSAGPLPGGPPPPRTGEGGNCLVCKAKHDPSWSCVDIRSEISLRVAIDAVRANEPQAQAYRELLIRQLQQLRSR
ncbi:PHD/FYVE-zinc-finger like domain-containing protein [Hypoxylon sp. NC1633]|nr:PHD/FYVE-zinc-finger like domain-containing protein [Hypoxylon sp. NC1633]